MTEPIGSRGDPAEGVGRYGRAATAGADRLGLLLLGDGGRPKIIASESTGSQHLKYDSVDRAPRAVDENSEVVGA